MFRNETREAEREYREITLEELELIRTKKCLRNDCCVIQYDGIIDNIMYFTYTEFEC
jgi:hypothetical protein